MEINGDLRELKGYLEGERCIYVWLKVVVNWEAYG
jgi:hypothetical protein